MAMKLCPNCGLEYPDDATHCTIDRTPLEDAPDPYLGALIAGRYRIETLLGEGGMGTVYRARQALPDRLVVVKVFRKELARDPKLRERFRREATNTARLAHPNIVEIMDSGETDDGAPYLVMEFLDGETLADVLRHGPVPLPRALDIMVQVLGALARAHDFQVIHRDLKPDNLFVVRAEDGSDLVKILDFGIARSMHDPRLTGTGEVFGTPQYMAPERITSIDTGPAADLYAIGVILYALVTNRLPFQANDAQGYLLKHLRDPPPLPRKFNPAVPRPLEAVILRLLEKDPARRPVDAHAVRKELAALAQTMPKPAPGPRPAQRPAPDPPPPAVTAPPPPSPPPSKADTTRTSRPRAAALAATTPERWAQRVAVFGQMLAAVFPGGDTRADLAAAFAQLRAGVARIAEVRARSHDEQAKVESLAQRTREAQTRFGHAMDALGTDLSATRVEVQRVREIDAQYAEREAQAGAPIAALHAWFAAHGPSPAAELDALLRAALEALPHATHAAAERARAATYLQAREREASDTEFQIHELRAQLARLSQSSEDERAASQKVLEAMAAEVTAIEQKLVADANALADVLRPRRDLAALFTALEADAA